MIKSRLCTRLRLCCRHLRRRPCRPFPLGAHFVSDPPLPRCRCRQAYDRRGLMVSLVRILLHPPSHDPPPTARKPGPPRTTPPSEASPRLSIDPVPTVPIRPTTDPVTPAPPLLGTLSPDAPRRASTPAALPEIPSPAETERIEPVKRYMHSDWARAQRAEPVCDAAIRRPLLGSPSALPNDFLLHLAPHKRPPLSEVRSLADKGRPYTDDDGTLLLARKPPSRSG